VRLTGFRAAAMLSACLLLFQGLLAAQARPGLRIIVVDGEGAINNIQLGSGREPVVEVRDENDRPVSGAKVLFTLPDSGAGGTFFGASRNLTISTNDQGRAAGTGFRPNLQEGRFQIRVTATMGDKTAESIITQSNALPSSSVNRAAGGKRGFGAGKIIAIIAVAAVGGVIGATRGGDEAAVTPAQGTSITPGTVSVGPPR